MNPEKRQLLEDLLAGDNRRETTLLAGARVLRRRRVTRVAGRALIMLAAVIIVATWLVYTPQKPAVQVAKQSPTRKSLTDEELLSLFPDTPVALATLPDGRKQLIFPRPGDQQKFVKRL